MWATEQDGTGRVPEVFNREKMKAVGVAKAAKGRPHG